MKEKLEAKWQAEIAELGRRAEQWETGTLRAYFNGTEVTDQQAPMLRRHANALRQALDILRAE